MVVDVRVVVGRATVNISISINRDIIPSWKGGDGMGGK